MNGSTYEISGGEGYGFYGWVPGQIIRTPQVFCCAPYSDYPEFLKVTETSRDYYSEDGMSFGVGDEQGYVHRAVCVEATPEESAPILEREQAAREAAEEAAIEFAEEARRKSEERSANDLTIRQHGLEFRGEMICRASVVGPGDTSKVNGSPIVWHASGLYLDDETAEVAFQAVYERSPERYGRQYVTNILSSKEETTHTPFAKWLDKKLTTA